jgi:hypothetical protein
MGVKLGFYVMGRKCSKGVENGVLRGIFGCKGEETTEDLRKLHDEGFTIFTPRQVFYRIFRSRKMGWAGHEAQEN